MRATGWIVSGVVIAAAAGAGLWYFKFRKQDASAATAPAASSPADRPVAVSVALVEKRDVPIYVEGLGSITPLYTVTVKSQVDGRLDKVLFTEGQTVKKGEWIAQIDARPFQIQLHTADAAIARDNATLKNARLDLDRYKTLRQQNLIPQQQADTQQMLVEQTMASVLSDQAQAEAARLNIDYARITSPIDGVTGVRLVDPGNIIHASDPTGIVLITQLDPIGVIFTLPEDDFEKVSKYMSAGTLEVEVRSRDAGKLLGKGNLSLIDNQINQATATIRLKATLRNSDKTLWPNEFVKARLTLTIRKDVLVIPAPAIQIGKESEPGKDPPKYVYVVNEDMSATQRFVHIEPPQDNLAILLGDELKLGDKIVIDGYNQIKPGSKVNIRSPAGAAGSASGAPTQTHGAPADAPPTPSSRHRSREGQEKAP